MGLARVSDLGRRSATEGGPKGRVSDPRSLAALGHRGHENEYLSLQRCRDRILIPEGASVSKKRVFR
jgi:hypothetical protein